MVGGPRLEIKSNAAQGPETEETEEKSGGHKVSAVQYWHTNA